jgi:hypothetical protein
MSENAAPKALSANGTIYQLSVIFYPYRALLGSGKEVNRTTLPPYITTLARKRLGTLRPIAHKDLQPLVADMAAFIEAIDGFAAHSVAGDVVMLRAQNLEARFASLDRDPNFIEKLVREAY